MTVARVATIGTVGAVVVWALKALAIGAAGGLGRSPVEGLLFFVGMLLFAVGVVAIGLAVTAGRPAAVRLLGLLLTVAAVFVLWLLVDTAVAALAPATDPHWAWAEAQLWLMSVLTAAGWLAWGRQRRAAPARAHG